MADMWNRVKEWSGVSKRGSPELSRSQYSLVSCGDLTPGAVRLWAGLPDEVKFDPALAPYREYYENEYGKLKETKKDLHPVTKRLPSVSSAPHLNNNQPKSNKEEFELNDFQNGRQVHAEFYPRERLPHENEVEIYGDNTLVKNTKLKQTAHLIKMTSLLLCWVFFTVIFMMYSDKKEVFRNTAVTPGETKSYSFNLTTDHMSVLLKLSGPFLSDQLQSNLDINELGRRNKMYVWLERMGFTGNGTEGSVGLEATKPWSIVLTRNIDFNVGEIRSKVLNLACPGSEGFLLRINTSAEEVIPFTLGYRLSPLDPVTGVVYSCVLLVALYILIIFEIINRTMAAILLSTTSLAVLCLAGERPSLPELVSWLDVETLLLLFSMMILVAVMAETGLFDYLAVFTFQVTKGKLWPLINLLSVTTAILSLILDNVTTILLMTPVTIRLCEVMGLDPVPVLMSMVLFTNVGGTATPVGDPPNVIIASNKDVAAAGIDFTTFTLHMSLGIFFVMIQTYVQIRFMYRDTRKLRVEVPRNIKDLRHKMAVWQKTVDSLKDLSKEEVMVKERLESNIRKMSVRIHVLERESKKRACPKDVFDSTLAELKEKYMIRDSVLLLKAAVVTLFIVVVFFLHSVLKNVSLGWTALLGAILLLILADKADLEPILHKVEWPSLLFFAALFVFMEALAKLGFTQFIGDYTESLILRVGEEYRLAVALITLLWVSGIVSAFVDNVPLTTMMIRIVTALGTNPGLNLPLAPLIWALSFGVCLGGNGTLIGASANVVCAGVAEQHGYKFSFLGFLKVGFPVMIGQLMVASVYLLICHCVFHWH